MTDTKNIPYTIKKIVMDTICITLLSNKLYKYRNYCNGSKNIVKYQKNQILKRYVSN